MASQIAEKVGFSVELACGAFRLVELAFRPALYFCHPERTLVRDGSALVELACG